MNVEKVVEWEVAGETEALRENVPQWFVHHKPQMMWPLYIITNIKPVFKDAHF